MGLAKKKEVERRKVVRKIEGRRGKGDRKERKR